MTDTTIEQPEKLKDVLKSVIDEIGENEIIHGTISFDRKTNLGSPGYEKWSDHLEINLNVVVSTEKNKRSHKC